MTHDERFEQLFRENYADLLAYAVRRCVSRQDAEDVVAETFAVAWRRLDELPPGERTRLWLFGTARLVRLNHHRRRDRRLRLLERVGTMTAPDAATDVADELSSRARIRAALAGLPERDREVLQLHVWEELTAEEIGQVLELSTSAVWKRLQRARDRLVALLEEEADGPATGHPTSQIAREATR